eukprot:RCo039420
MCWERGREATIRFDGTSLRVVSLLSLLHLRLYRNHVLPSFNDLLFPSTIPLLCTPRRVQHPPSYPLPLLPSSLSPRTSLSVLAPALCPQPSRNPNPTQRNPPGNPSVALSLSLSSFEQRLGGGGGDSLLFSLLFPCSCVHRVAPCLMTVRACRACPCLLALW